jgi:hypothetical protein
MKRCIGFSSCFLLFFLLVAWPSKSQGVHSITLSWIAPVACSATVTTNCGGAAVSYNVKRSITTGAEVTITSVPAPTVTFVDTTGTAGVKYFYVVSAVNTFGESPNSTEVSATFLGDKPVAPTGPAAVAN